MDFNCFIQEWTIKIILIGGPGKKLWIISRHWEIRYFRKSSFTTTMPKSITCIHSRLSGGTAIYFITMYLLLSTESWAFLLQIYLIIVIFGSLVGPLLFGGGPQGIALMPIGSVRPWQQNREIPVHMSIMMPNNAVMSQ